MELKIEKLENGTTLIYSQKPETKFFSVTYGFNVGSLEETNENRGIAHLIEHMIFNGSKNFTKDEIVENPSYYGGSINANTCKVVTQYELDVLDTYYKEALNIINDMTFNPLFDLLEKEKGVVCQEIYRSNDNHSRLLINTRNSLFVDEDVKIPVLGTLDSINNMKKEQLVDFHNKYYVTNNLVVSITSSLPYEEVKEYLKSIIPNDRKKEVVHRTFDYSVSGKYAESYKEDLSQTKLVKSFMVPDRIKNKGLIYFIDGLFLSSMSSRFFKELRETQTLCYELSGMVESVGNESAIVSLYISYGDESKTEHIISEVDRLFSESLTTNRITEQEFTRVKNSILGTVYSLRENEHEYMKSIVRTFFNNNKHIDIYETEKQIQEITLEDVENFIKEYFVNNESFVAVLKNKVK